MDQTFSYRSFYARENAHQNEHRKHPNFLRKSNVGFIGIAFLETSGHPRLWNEYSIGQIALSRVASYLLPEKSAFVLLSYKEILTFW